MTDQLPHTPSFFYLYLWLFCLVASLCLLSAIMVLLREMAKEEPPDDIAPEIREGWLWHQIRRKIK